IGRPVLPRRLTTPTGEICVPKVGVKLLVDLVAEHFQPDIEIRDRVPNRPEAYPPNVEVWIATGCDDTARCIILCPLVRLGDREDVLPRDQIAEGQLCRVVEAHGCEHAV